MYKDSGISMLKTEWKENFVYKPKELLQLFQSLPSAKMRMRTKIIVQVRVTRNHLIFFPSEFVKKFCRITQEFHCNLLWSCSLSNYRPRILEKFRLDDVCLTKKVLKIPETLCFLQNYLRKNSTAIYFFWKWMFVSRRIVVREFIRDSFLKILCLRILMGKAVFDNH